MASRSCARCSPSATTRGGSSQRSPPRRPSSSTSGVRKRTSVLRRALTRVRDLVAQGRLEGGENIGRLGLHDGMLIIDADGMIQYASSVAEGLYRLIGSWTARQHPALGARHQRVPRVSGDGVRRLPGAARHRAGPRLDQEGDPAGGRRRPRPGQSAAGLRSGATRSARSSSSRTSRDDVRKEQELKVKSAMIQEIHHRVKNNLQTITALLRLQARRVESEDAALALKEAVGRIMSVAVVHEFLSQDEVEHHQYPRRLQAITQEFVTRHARSDEADRAEAGGRSASSCCRPQQATSCALIVNELIQNAVDHGWSTETEGTVVVRLLQTDDSMCDRDRGRRRGLARRASTLPQGGLGLQIIRTLVRDDLKGQFLLEDGDGVRAVVSFPALATATESTCPRPRRSIYDHATYRDRGGRAARTAGPRPDAREPGPRGRRAGRRRPDRGRAGARAEARISSSWTSRCRARSTAWARHARWPRSGSRRSCC